MLLCDHIIFWANHYRRPKISEADLNKYFRGSSDRILLLCKVATARMLGRFPR
jgi:hypothetical protein